MERMIARKGALLAVGCAALALSGCVAAVIPVAASGMIGRSTLHRHQRDAASPAPAAQHPATLAAATAQPTPVPIPAVPADRAAMKVGQAYLGDLPPPTGSPPPPSVAGTAGAAGATPTAAADHSPSTVWTDVMHRAATASLKRPTASALLAKGSTTATPRWVPCGDKPVAVLVNLPAAGTTDFFRSAMEDLTAIETMGVSLLFASDQPPAVVAHQQHALTAGGVGPLVEGATLFSGKPGTGAATRAAIGARYCVVAVVGSRAADFPNAVLPDGADARPGWFLIR